MEKRESPNASGYTQTYLVRSTGSECTDENCTHTLRDCFFRCGNWCYSGEVKLEFQHAFGMSLETLPEIVPILQRQQNSLSYLCSALDVPDTSEFKGPLQAMEDARDFVVSELQSDDISSLIQNIKESRRWIESDESQYYFELVGDASDLFPNILCIASKVYSRGLIFVTIYFEGIIYVTIEDGSGDQPLLDVSFPNVSEDGEGATLAMYDADRSGRNGPWMKLSIWRSVSQKSKEAGAETPRPTQMKPVRKDLSNDRYVQCYCIRKPREETPLREVFFRFGSWCYTGSVELVPRITFEDISAVIPALRLQQRKLDFVSDVSSLPPSNPFVLPMEYAANAVATMESEAAASEDYLRTKIAIDGSSENGKHWLEDDNSFFEFTCVHDKVLDDIELIVTKSYNPNGIITISVYYGDRFYLVIKEGNNHPLLDSRIPSITKGEHGFQWMPKGNATWPQLRKIAIWRNVTGEAKVESVEKEKLPESSGGDSDSSGCQGFSIEDELPQLNLDGEGSVDGSKQGELQVQTQGEKNPDQRQGGQPSKTMVNDDKLVEDSVEDSVEDHSAAKIEQETLDLYIAETTISYVSIDEAKLESKDASKKVKLCGDHTVIEEGYASVTCNLETNYHVDQENLDGDEKKAKIASCCGHSTKAATSASGTVEAAKKPIRRLKLGKEKTKPPILTSGVEKQSLGAFHHLAPMKKPSRLDGKLGYIGRKNVDGLVAPWDSDGRPQYQEGTDKNNL